MRYRSDLIQPKRVSDSGAPSGCVLRGTSPLNEGLRLKVLRDQPRGEGGPIQGQFQILEVGVNKHSASLERLLGVTTEASEVIAIIRRVYPACVSVVNANMLMVEGETS